MIKPSNQLLLLLITIAMLFMTMNYEINAEEYECMILNKISDDDADVAVYNAKCITEHGTEILQIEIGEE